MICGRPRTGLGPFVLALLDLSVVFDTINHDILLDWPLGSLWFSSFFYDKFHSVGLGARGSCNKGCLRASVFCPFCLTFKCWERSFNSSSISMLQCNLVTLHSAHAVRWHFDSNFRLITETHIGIIPNKCKP